MALIGLAASVLSAGALPNADEIVRQSVANTQADWRAAPDYNFTERDVTVKHGSRSVKTYRVRMIDGAPYYELTAMTGGPLSPAQTRYICWSDFRPGNPWRNCRSERGSRQSASECVWLPRPTSCGRAKPRATRWAASNAQRRLDLGSQHQKTLQRL